MKQFDVYPNQTATQDIFPYYVILQHDFYRSARTTIVCPLATAEAFPQASRLNPEVRSDRLGDRPLRLAIQQLTAIDIAELADAPLASLSSYRSEIVSALDLLFTGV